MKSNFNKKIYQKFYSIALIIKLSQLLWSDDLIIISVGQSKDYYE